MIWFGKLIKNRLRDKRKKFGLILQDVSEKVSKIALFKLQIFCRKLFFLETTVFWLKAKRVVILKEVITISVTIYTRELHYFLNFKIRKKSLFQ